MARNIRGLKPFPKGVSGNPGGRPKKRPITDEYFGLADQPIPEKIRLKLEKSFEIEIKPGSTWSQCGSLRLFLQALGLKADRGAAKSAKELREAMEGKAPQRLEISTAPKTEITVKVKFDKTKT